MVYTVSKIAEAQMKFLPKFSVANLAKPQLALIQQAMYDIQNVTCIRWLSIITKLTKKFTFDWP